MEIGVSSLVESLRPLLENGKSVIIRVRGNSMYPFFRNNQDLVILEQSKANEFHNGQIVLFRYENRYLLHRIIKKKGTNYYLRGDNNWSFHLEACREEDIVGIVVKVRRNGHEIGCDSWQWRLLSLLWVKTHGARVSLYHFYRYCRELKYKLKWKN